MAVTAPRPSAREFSTQGDTWEELREMVLDATRGYFADSEAPTVIRLHRVSDEVLKVA